jgi:cellulose synthase (UDP-forming)
MLQLHRRLAWTFRAELTWFERKLYASLSHESNKAMNINSYLGLMGRSFEPRESAGGAGLVLAPAANSGSIQIPDADYILTLDADSVLLPEYCLRLVHVLQQPENARVAVAQTPYSAFPGSATRIERLAGGTTDLQHIVHQGMGYHDATFWVGANAVIRKCALEDIVETELDGEREIRRYVQDRTVIEDTESTMDLTINGWRLLNYPERLSYSTTPPDFGALSIQRRRWANGGLLILAKLSRTGRNAPAAANAVRCCKPAFGSTTWPQPAGVPSDWCFCWCTRSTASCSAR